MDMKATARGFVLLAAAGTSGSCADDIAVPIPPEEDDPLVLAKPPSPPESPEPGNGPGQWYAVTHFFSGLRSRNGEEDVYAWKQFGFDLDGRATTANNLTHTCRDRAGAQVAYAAIDGVLGIDTPLEAR